MGPTPPTKASWVCLSRRADTRWRTCRPSWPCGKGARSVRSVLAGCGARTDGLGVRAVVRAHRCFFGQGPAGQPVRTGASVGCPVTVTRPSGGGAYRRGSEPAPRDRGTPGPCICLATTPCQAPSDGNETLGLTSLTPLSLPPLGYPDFPWVSLCRFSAQYSPRKPPLSPRKFYRQTAALGLTLHVGMNSR